MPARAASITFDPAMNVIATRIESFLHRADEALLKDRRWLLLLFFFALGVKLVYVIQASDSIQFKIPILDEKYYDKIAQEIAAGQIMRKEAFFMGPLYPYFLSVVYSIFGRDLVAARIVQMIGGALTVLLTYKMGQVFFRPTVGFVAAVMLIFYGAVTFYEGQLLMMWLGTIINMTLILILAGGVTEKTSLRSVLSGALLGLSSLARANVLLFAPFALGWLAWRDKGCRLKSTLLFLLFLVLGILPATLHNYLASRDFVLVTSNAGVNLYIGNGEEATGAFYPPKGVDFITDATTRKYVERMMGRDMKPSEISRYWIEKAIEFAKKHPGRELALLLKKTALFFNGFEVPQIESYDLSKKRYGIFKILFLNFWIVCSLGLVGMICTTREWKKYFILHWFVLSYAASIIIFFVTARYRVQLAPLLCLFGSYALLVVFPRSAARAWRGLKPLLLIAVILFLTRPSFFAYDMDRMLFREHVHQARRLAMAGQEEPALEEINKAVAMMPDNPEPYVHRAIIYKGGGKLFQAIEDYTRALKLSPWNPSVHYDLAQALRKARMYTAAIEEYLIAIEQDSLMTQAYNNLGITYRELKEYGRAVKYFKKALRIDPKHIKAYNNLGSCLAESGKVDEAVEYFLEAIKRDPSYSSSYKNLAMALIEQRKLEEAKAYLEKYLELNPVDRHAAEILHKVRVAIEADSTGS